MSNFVTYRFFLLMLVFSFCGGSAIAEITVIRYPRPQSDKDSRHIYRIRLLELAMDKTLQEYGPYRIDYSAETMSQARALVMIRNDSGIDLIALPASKQRVEDFLPVRVSLLRDLLGYRIFIIRSQDRERFSKVRSIRDLYALKAGAGHDWLDSAIMEGNNLPVVRSPDYERLFLMLDRQRFDYFPRGVNEAFEEMRRRKGVFPNLEVETTLALYYPFPVYFFVRKDNHRLAARIEKGLNAALADGSFDRLFLQFNGEYLRHAGLEHRRIFRLENPFLP
jgi:hypothetical protein